jgi:hypothetical protein
MHVVTIIALSCFKCVRSKVTTTTYVNIFSHKLHVGDAGGGWEDIDLMAVV